MRTVLLAVILVLASAVQSLAQNRCDIVPPNNPQLNSPHNFAFGWDGKDTDGAVVDPASVQVKLIVNGTARPLVPLPAPTGTATASGCNWYVFPNQTTAKGSHTVTATLVTADGEGTAPAPFAFGIKGKPPTAVQRVQAIQ